MYIREIAKKLEVPPESIRTDVEKQIRKRTRQKQKDNDTLIRQKTVGYGDRVNPDFAKDPGLARKEEAVLGLLMLYPEHRAIAFAEPPLLTEQDFFTGFGKRVFAFIRDAEREEGFDKVSPDSVFTPEEVGRMMKMKLARMELTENGEAIFKESVAQLKNDVADHGSSGKATSVEELTAFLDRMRQK